MTSIPESTAPVAENTPETADRKLTRSERVALADKILDEAMTIFRMAKKSTGSDRAGLVAAWAFLAAFDGRAIHNIHISTAVRYIRMVEAGQVGEVARRLHSNAHAPFPFVGPNAPTPQELMSA